MRSAAIRDQLRCAIAAQIKENSEPTEAKLEKPKPALDIKSENPLAFSAKTENLMLNNGKSANRHEHQNRKTEVFCLKNRKTDLKIAKTAKPKIPAPLLEQAMR